MTRRPRSRVGSARPSGVATLGGNRRTRTAAVFSRLLRTRGTAVLHPSRAALRAGASRAGQHAEFARERETHVLLAHRARLDRRAELLLQVRDAVLHVLLRRARARGHE